MSSCSVETITNIMKNLNKSFPSPCRKNYDRNALASLRFDLDQHGCRMTSLF